MAETPPTLADVALANLRSSGMGTVRAYASAGKALATVAALAIAAAEHDEWPTQAEYAAHWKITERTAQREWALFRQAFPGEQTPDAFAQLIAAQRAKQLATRDRERLIAETLKFPAPRGLVAA